MMRRQRTTKQTPATPEEIAAGWLLREKSSLTQQERAERDAWLQLNPLNRDAYQRTHAMWNALYGLAGDQPMRELRREALAARPQKHPTSKRWRVGIAAGVIGLTLGVGGDYFFTANNGVTHEASTFASASNHGDATRYRTGVGERLSITLRDGTAVTLNTASELRTRFSKSERTVELVDGQAFFAVAKNEKVPFIVVAGDRQVTALGTAFDVRLDRDQVQVVLVEGKVAVAPLRKKKSRVELEPGERFVSSGETGGRVAAANVDTSTSWRSGRVVFTDTSLKDAVAEINRYLPRPILIGDGAVAELKISGTYRVSEAARFPEALAAYYPLQVLTRQTGEIVLESRQSRAVR